MAALRCVAERRMQRFLKALRETGHGSSFFSAGMADRGWFPCGRWTGLCSTGPKPRLHTRYTSPGQRPDAIGNMGVPPPNVKGGRHHDPLPSGEDDANNASAALRWAAALSRWAATRRSSASSKAMRSFSSWFEYVSSDSSANWLAKSPLGRGRSSSSIDRHFVAARALLSTGSVGTWRSELSTSSRRNQIPPNCI